MNTPPFLGVVRGRLGGRQHRRMSTFPCLLHLGQPRPLLRRHGLRALAPRAVLELAPFAQLARL